MKSVLKRLILALSFVPFWSLWGILFCVVVGFSWILRGEASVRWADSFVDVADNYMDFFNV